MPLQKIKPETKLDRRTLALQKFIEAMSGAVGKPMGASRSTVPLVVLYKVMEKMFAILSVRGDEFVIVKCDANLVPVLKKQYEGIGRRSHLDPRYWICINLDSDVPLAEIKRLVRHSYALVCSGLTRKQQSKLSAMGTKGA